MTEDSFYKDWGNKEAAKDALLRKLAERFADDAEIAALIRTVWGDGE